MIAIVLSLALACPPAPGASGEDDFRRGLDDVHRLMEARSWSSAQGRLAGLLADHEGEDYVLAELATLREDAKRCAFWTRQGAPDFRSLVSGKLVSYSPNTGAIRVRYGPDEMADFEATGEPTAGRRVFHPLTFDGAYSVEVRGDAYPATPNGRGPVPTVWVCVTREEAYAVVFGTAPRTDGNKEEWIPASVTHFSKGEPERIAALERPPVEAGERYALKVDVTASEILLSYNGRRYLRARKERGLYGRVGVEGLGDFGGLEIHGSAQTSWLDGLADAAVRDQWESFAASYDESRYLPRWLTTAPSGSKTTSSDPDDDDGDPRKAVYAEYVEIRDARGAAAGLEFVQGLERGRVDEAYKELLLGQAFYDGGEYERALEHADRAAAGDRRLLDARVVRARALDKLRRRDEAISQYREVLGQSPGTAFLYEELAWLLLVTGDLAEAKSVIGLAQARRLESLRLDELARLIVKATRGPEWGEVFRDESAHYVVLSDIDAETCRDAARVLEESYREYCRSLHPIPDAEQRKFRVYLFSGFSGYRAYAREVLGHQAENTAGLYSPELKQLLIWNLPERDDMFRTVKHEGFHQYLDRLMESPPTWFNEGLAEYFEITSGRRARSASDLVHYDHLRALQTEPSRPPLEEFLYLDAAAFYADMETNYAYAWAFVHFLLHSSRRNAILFDRLFDALLEPGDSLHAVRRVFARVDLDAMEREFEQHVAGLQPSR